MKNLDPTTKYTALSNIHIVIRKIKAEKSVLSSLSYYSNKSLIEKWIGSSATAN